MKMEKIDYQTLKDLCSVSEERMNKSFNMIFSKYSKLVYFVSFEILKNEEESKEIVNDTFMKMYEKRRVFMNESRLKYFLLVTAKNLSINRYNKLKNHLTYSDDVEVEDHDKKGDLDIYLERFKKVLDKEEYSYLVLHLIYEFSFREIANHYELTTSQVSSKYQRGIKKLRSFYGGLKDE